MQVTRRMFALVIVDFTSTLWLSPRTSGDVVARAGACACGGLVRRRVARCGRRTSRGERSGALAGTLRRVPARPPWGADLDA